MAGISTAIELTDRMSYPIQAITSSLQNIVDVMDDVTTSMDSSFDSSKITAARISMDEANASINEMLEHYNKASSGANNFSNNINNAKNKTEQFNSALQEGASATNSLFNSLMGFAIIQKGISMITSQVGSAIDRLDTLNNYPKVMANLGIGANEANASMQMLSEGLRGLPTTLNDAVGSVQRFTSANKNIGASTKMFLALNNAILAGGAEMSTQQSALEQLSQSYAKGKPDMMEWRTAMTAMPAQLGQVATAMGFVSADALGESLRNGKTSMNDFMNTLIQLNETSANGFPSLAEQAKNATGGIKTSIENMKTSVTRGIANMMTTINTAMESTGLGTIQDVIVSIGTNLEIMLTNIGNFAANAIMYLQPIISFVQIIGQFISDNWSIISPILYGLIAVLAIYATYTAIVTMATKAWAAAQAIFNGIMAMNPIFLIIIAVVALIAVIYAVIGAINKITGSSISATGVICGAITAAVALIWNLFLSLLDLVLGVINAMVNPWISFANFFANLFNDPIGAIVHLFGDFADSILGVIETIAKALDKVFGSNLAGAVSGWRSGLSGMVEKVANQYGNGSYEKVAEELNLSSESLGLKRWEYGDAYNTGYNFGSNLESNIGNMFSNGLDVNGLGNNFGNNLDTALANIAGNTADIAGNTGKINDSLTTSEEDLKYLLDLAEQETVNRYTTNEIKIELGGVTNNINNETDLDGVVDYIAGGIYEAMEKAAEGVHE